MRTQPVWRRACNPFILLILFSLTACGALETEIEHTPTPTSGPTATAPATISLLEAPRREITTTLSFVPHLQMSGPTTTYTDAGLGIAFDFPSGWEVDGHQGAEGHLISQDETGTRQSLLDFAAVTEGDLDTALGEVKRGAWGPYIRDVQPMRLGEFDSLRLDFDPGEDRPPVVWLVVTPSGHAVAFIPRSDLAQAVLATLRAMPPDSLAPGTDAVIDCAAVYPGMPGCLRDESLAGGRLAFVDARPPFDYRTTVIDLERGGAWTLGETPGGSPRWSPSGDYVLVTLGERASAIYRYDGEVVTTYDIPLPVPPLWAPPDSFPSARDWLAVPTRDGALLAVPCPAGETRPVLPPGSLGNNGRGIVCWSRDGWLAWTLTTDQLIEAGQWEQDLYVRSVEATSEPTTLRLSDDIRETYYQLIEWVPGTRLILAGRGMVAVSLWSWGVPLVTINTDTGEITDMGAAMLLTPEAYAWHPTRPSLLALAEGGSRYLYETGRLALLDVTTGDLTYLTDEEMAVFEPTWSPDGTLLAYAAVPASPDAHGNGETLEHTLDGRAIYVTNPQTCETRALTTPGDGIDGWPQWAADGTRLLYTRQHDGQTDVRVVTLDGSHDELLVTGLPDPTCHYGGCGWRQMLAYYPCP